MSLKDVSSSLPLVMATTLENPYDRIVIPCLKEANFFKMGVGFFESDWIDLAKDGVLTFVQNGGKMELLTSVQVGEEEFKAFQLGEQAKTDEILMKILVEKAIQNATMHGKDWTLNYLAWMISQGILEVRLLIHKTSNVHMYHDKMSFWYDSDGNSVCFQGSLNSTRNAISNEEAMALYASWRPGGADYIAEFERVWDHDWDGRPEQYVLMKLPEIVKAEYRRIGDPYNPHAVHVIRPPATSKSSSKAPKPREYQETAIERLQQNGYRGILAMATGTGKTFTSLFAVRQNMETFGNALVLICVPQTTLIKQWIDTINTVFGYPKIHVCAFNKSDWFSALASSIRLFRGSNPLFAITTYDSLTNQEFQILLTRFKGNFIYVFDECHKLGTPTIITKFAPKEPSYRIGLSATPERWFDGAGTDYIKQVIGNTVYEYSMEEAIATKKLCEYNYHIILSELTDDETNQFIKLTTQLSKAVAASDGDELSDSAKLLLEKRARISKKAVNKWEDFFAAFGQYQYKTGSIVYVFDEQVDDMIAEIKKRFPALNVHGIVASTKPEDREKILKGFNDHEIDVIVAIQCLDEGVDVPNCHAEFILASSTNPREFIQRRGRVLRLSKENPSKIADIFDFVTIARDTEYYTNDEKAAVIKRELARVAEFVRLSRNREDNNLIQYLADIESIALYAQQEPWKNRVIEEDD